MVGDISMSSSVTHEENRPKSYINWDMIPAKLTFIFSEGYLGSVNPFFNIFYVSLGLTPSQAGLITGISYAVSSLAGPLWTALVDYTGQRKIIFIILCLGTASSIFSIPWVTLACGTYEYNVTCLQNVSSNKLSNVTFEHVCFSKSHLTNSNVLFYALLSLNIVSWIFSVTLPNYIDAIVVTVIKSRKRNETYGAQRVFGGIGFGVTNFLAGVAIDYYKPNNGVSQYAAAFYIFLPCVLLLIPAGCILINQIQWDGNINNSINTSFSSHLLSFLRKSDTIMFFATIAISGLAFNVYFNFLFLFMDEEMNSSKTIMTLTVVVCTVTDLLGYAYSTQFMKLLGTIPVITIGICSYVPRFIIMSFVKNSWFALPIQLLDPFALALSWPAQLEYVYQLAPEEITTTAINIIASIEFVASNAIANIAGGIAYHTYGGPVLFRACGIICGVWGIWMVIYYHYISRYVKRHCTSNVV